VPNKYALPEKAEEWINFVVPESLLPKSASHEDKMMVSKWSFIKPELTYYHLVNIANILEKINLEKIKGLKDPADDLKSKAVAFNFEDDKEPLVLE